MNVRNCKRCGRLFNYAIGPIMCPACKDALDAKFKQVKEYIRDNKGCGIQQVAEECDVEVSQIQQWLREERLEFTSESMITLSCESCGATIRSGRFCDKCKNNMINGFRGTPAPAAPAEPKKDTKENPRMRFMQ